MKLILCISLVIGLITPCYARGNYNSDSKSTQVIEIDGNEIVKIETTNGVKVFVNDGDLQYISYVNTVTGELRIQTVFEGEVVATKTINIKPQKSNILKLSSVAIPTELKSGLGYVIAGKDSTAYKCSNRQYATGNYTARAITVKDKLVGNYKSGFIDAVDSYEDEANLLVKLESTVVAGEIGIVLFALFGQPVSMVTSAVTAAGATVEGVKCAQRMHKYESNAEFYFDMIYDIWL